MDVSTISVKHVRKTGFALLIAIAMIASQMPAAAQCNYGWATISVSSPASGTSYVQGTVCAVRWSSGYYTIGSYGGKYKVEYSSDNGTSWTLVSSTLDGYTKSYNWTVPLTAVPTTTYRIRVSEVPAAGWCTQSSPGTSAAFTVLSACKAPNISTSPRSQSICGGQPVTFTVSSDMINGTYEWFKDGVSLGAPTRSNSYTIPVTTLASDGMYSVTLRDDCNPTVMVTTSATAKLTIIEPPAFSVNLPATRVVCESGNDTLRVRAVGAGRRFQWFKDGVAITGATDSNYIINNAQATSATMGRYHVVVTGTCSPSATSVMCDLTVAARPRITRNPSPLAVCPGSNGNTLSVTATGQALSYQWYKDGVLINGATSSSLTFNNYDLSMNGNYYCVVKSEIPNPNNCVVTAQSSTVRVSGFRVPVVKTQPKGLVTCTGGSATLVAEFDGTGLAYQWFKDGQPLAGQTANALVLSSIKADASGRYVVVATGTCGLYSASDTVSVSVIAKPAITKQPQAATLTVGERLSLTIEGSNIQSVQWYKNDVAIKDATTTTYTVASVVKANAGYYTARIVNSCGAVVSGAAKVDVNDPVVPRPAIELAQTSVEFGEIPAGYNKSITMSGLIKNIGNAPLTVTDLRLSPSDFSMSNAPSLPLTIAPGADQTLIVVATPTSKGTVNGTLTIRSNAPLTPQTSVALSATYVLRYDAPASTDFGLLETGKSSDKCVTLTNNSTQAITIDQASVIGMNASEFSVVTAMPVTIAAGASAEICVKFSPGTVGSKSAQLSLRSSTGGNSTVDLKGRAETPGGVVDAVETGVAVFPSPATDVIEVRFGKAMPSMTFSIVNAAGATVASMSSESVEAGSAVRWNIADKVASGAYTLMVRFGENVTTLPIRVVR